jgi:hypothetical protein
MDTTPEMEIPEKVELVAEEKHYVRPWYIPEKYWNECDDREKFWMDYMCEIKKRM